MTKLRTALIWSFAERYASLIITISTTLVLARILTPTQIGIFSLCAAFTAIAGILRDFGVSEYLIQEKDLSKEKIQAALGVALLVAWTIGTIVFFARRFIAEYYNEQGLAEILAVLSLNFFLLPFASPSFALLSREMAFRKIFVVQITSNAVQAATSMMLAYRGYGYMSLAWGPVTGILIQTLMLAFLRPEGTLVLPSLKQAGSVLNYGSMFAASRLIETFTRNAHEFVVARQFGFAAVGLFSRAFGLIELFNTNIASAILRVATPSFASDHRAGIDLTKAFARGTAIFTSVAWPFFGFVALMSVEVIRVLFGPQWDAAAPIATILALAVMPTYLYALGPNLLGVTGHVKTRLKISLVFSPVHLTGVFLASFISMQMVATVWFATNLLMLGLYVHYLRIVLDTTVNKLFSLTVSSVVVACTSLIAQVLTLKGCQDLNISSLATLAFVSASGSVAWILAVWICKHPVYDEVMRLIRRPART